MNFVLLKIKEDMRDLCCYIIYVQLWSHLRVVVYRVVIAFNFNVCMYCVCIMFKCSMESVYVECMCARVFTPWTTRRIGCPNSGGSSPGSHAQRQLCWGRRRWLRQSAGHHTLAAFGCSPGWSAGKSCACYWKSYHRPAPKSTKNTNN